MSSKRVRLIRSFGFLCTLAALVTAVGCGSGPAAAPTTFSDYNSSGGTFACKYPDGWKAEGGGKRGLEWAKFVSGSTEIRVDAGAAASLMGDIAKNLGKMEDDSPAPELTPVYAVHTSRKEEAEKNFSGYKEVGKIELFEAPLGPACRNEFTSATSFGTALHGYRATLLGNDKGVYVSCICPETDWDTLEPAFDTILKSLHRGQAE